MRAAGMSPAGKGPLTELTTCPSPLGFARNCDALA